MLNDGALRLISRSRQKDGGGRRRGGAKQRNDKSPKRRRIQKLKEDTLRSLVFFCCAPLNYAPLSPER